MKIYFYINTLGGGGAERNVATLASQLAEAGHKVDVITSFEVEHEYVLPQSVHRYNLETFDGTNDSVLRKNCRRVSRLIRIIKRDRPDVLISFMAEANFRSIIACLGRRTKTLLAVCNDPDREYPNIAYRILGKYLYRLADGIVFQTKEEQMWFPKSIRDHSRIIMNPISQQFFDAAFSGIRRDVVSVGRMVPQKNYEMLIRAFASIANQIEDNLYIYGEGELREELEALVRELHMDNRIFLPGAVRDVAETIKGAKLFVLSSDYEGLPNALMEAMALGLPCIATDCPCGGPRELIIDRENGLLIPVGNESVLGERILYLLKHPELLIKIQNNAQKSACRFRFDIVFNKWENYIGCLAAKNR